MSRCPYCGAEAADAQAEVAHMNIAHPEIVAERLESAGFVRVGDRWEDRFSDASAPARDPITPYRRYDNEWSE